MLITGVLMNYICMGYLESSSSQESICQTNGGKKKYMVDSAVRELFCIIATTLLSLIFPLSLLLLARLSTAHYLFLSFSNNYPSSSKAASFLCSLFLYANPIFPHLLVSFISVSCLTHTITNKVIVFISESPKNPLIRPRLYAAWIFLCVFQVCVGLGIEGSIAAGINGSGFISQEKGFLCRLIFFLGLHETMLFWGRMIVKPVVEDTIFGFSKTADQGWAEKTLMGLAYGGLWWWMLREEVEALVVVPELKRELKMGLGVADFVGWWLYYLTATIGIVKVVKGLIFTVIISTRGRVEEKSRPNDDKV